MQFSITTLQSKHSLEIKGYITDKIIIRLLEFTNRMSQENFFLSFFFFKGIFIVFKYIYLFYLFILAALGLCCCARAFSSCGERGLLFVAVRRLLISVVSLVVEHRL